MKYALLIYSAQGRPRIGCEPRAGDGVIDNWLDYTVAIKQAGVAARCRATGSGRYGHDGHAAGRATGC